jgi:hypothetical protein
VLAEISTLSKLVSILHTYINFSKQMLKNAEGAIKNGQYPMLPVSLDCPFFIASSVFSNFYLEGNKITNVQIITEFIFF